MKKLFLFATVLLLLVNRQAQAQTVLVIADSVSNTTETPESYFFKREAGKYNAVAISITKEAGAKKVMVKYTAATGTAKPQLIKIKLANGRTLTRSLKFVRKLVNDNPNLADNLFSFAATSADLELLQTFTVQNIVFLSAQQVLLTEIPVTDGKVLQVHLQHLAGQKEN